MTFNDYITVAAGAQLSILGEAVTYHMITGKTATIQAIINRDVEFFPDGFESTSSTRRNEITLLKSAAPYIKAGEQIVTDLDVLEIMDMLSDDGVVIVYTARVQ